MSFQGSFVALITPFKAEGEIDYFAFEELVDWQISEKVEGIVCAGTTGEGPCLTDGEKMSLLQICTRKAKGNTAVILSTGSNVTQKTVSLTEEAKSQGADGALVTVPYYNTPSMQGCFAHFQAIDRVGLPQIVYHHPKRTGVTLDVDTVEKLSRLPTVKTIKDCSESIEFVENILKCTELSILTGVDTFIAPMMEAGAKGSISVIGNVIPGIFREYIRLLLAGKHSEATQLWKPYELLIETMGLEVNPQCIKYALYEMNKCQLKYRLPMVAPEPFHQKRISEALMDASLTRPRPQTELV